MSEEGRIVQAEWGTKRRTLAWINTCVQVVVLLALLIVVNLLARRSPTRFDLTSSGTYEMSAETEDLLEKLNYDVDIWLTDIVYGAVQDKSLPVALLRTKELLNEFDLRSPRINLHLVVEGDHEQLTEIGTEWGGVSPGTIYMRATPPHLDDPTKKAIELYEIFEGNYKTGRLIRYMGEQVIAQTIRDLGGRTKRIFYEVEGHGEVMMANARVMGKLQTVLEKSEGVEIRRFKTAGARSVPLDCEVLLIMAPSLPFTPREIDILRDYLERGKSLLVALKPRVNTGLDPLFKEYGVKVNPDVVHDPRSFYSQDWKNVVITDFSIHPVNRGMVNVNFMMPMACSVEPVNQKNPKWKNEALARTGPSAWGETGDYSLKAGPKPDGNEKVGHLPLIVAVEKEPDKAPEGHTRKTRLVVWGSYGPFTNRLMVIRGPQQQYVINHFRWLGERQLMAPKGVPAHEAPLKMTPAELSKLFWVVVVGFPLFGFILGVVVWILRRK